MLITHLSIPPPLPPSLLPSPPIRFFSSKFGQIFRGFHSKAQTNLFSFLRLRNFFFFLTFFHSKSISQANRTRKLCRNSCTTKCSWRRITLGKEMTTITTNDATDFIKLIKPIFSKFLKSITRQIKSNSQKNFSRRYARKSWQIAKRKRQNAKKSPSSSRQPERVVLASIWQAASSAPLAEVRLGVGVSDREANKRQRWRRR